MDLGQFFKKDYTGPAFELFGGTHLVTLLVVVLFIVLLLRFKGSSETVRSRVRWSMAIVLWLVEASWHIWNLAVGTWNIQTMLPLHMCSVLIWLTGFMLIFKKYSIYDSTAKRSFRQFSSAKVGKTGKKVSDNCVFLS